MATPATKRAPRRPARPTSKYLHVSFAFLPEDKKVLAYCAKESGLTQTELVRRLTRHMATGGKVAGCVQVPAMPSLKGA
jgi:hypothetical protein